MVIFLRPPTIGVWYKRYEKLKHWNNNSLPYGSYVLSTLYFINPPTPRNIGTLFYHENISTYHVLSRHELRSKKF